MSEIKTIDDLLSAFCKLAADLNHSILWEGEDQIKSNDVANWIHAALMVEELKNHMELNQDHYRWRKVEDELPEINSQVIVCDKDRELHVVKYMVSGTNEGIQFCFDGVADFKGFIMSEAITHWRYLDKPEEAEK